MGTWNGRRYQTLFEPFIDDIAGRCPTARGSRRRAVPRVVIALVGAALFGLGLGRPTSALAGEGDVEGKVVFKPNKLGKPPVRNQGFLERLENPLRPVRSFNPRPYMVVVLSDGPVDEEAKKAPGGKVRYHLVGESFEKPLLPVIEGTRVEIVNSTTRKVTLFTPDDDAMAEPYTFNPRGMRDFKASTSADVIVIRSETTRHLEGRVVAFPHRYFVPVDRRGRFEIKDVPEGNWKVKVWYRDGWIEGVEQTIEVEKRRTADVDLTIAPDKVRAQN